MLLIKLSAITAQAIPACVTILPICGFGTPLNSPLVTLFPVKKKAEKKGLQTCSLMYSHWRMLKLPYHWSITEGTIASDRERYLKAGVFSLPDWIYQIENASVTAVSSSSRTTWWAMLSSWKMRSFQPLLRFTKWTTVVCRAKHLRESLHYLLQEGWGFLCPHPKQVHAPDWREPK